MKRFLLWCASLMGLYYLGGGTCPHCARAICPTGFGVAFIGAAIASFLSRLQQGKSKNADPSAIQ